MATFLIPLHGRNVHISSACCYNYGKALDVRDSGYFIEHRVITGITSMNLFYKTVMGYKTVTWFKGPI